MNTTAKLHPGQPFNAEVFKRVEGADFTFGAPGKWQALFVFRGHHCPICKSYLTKIEERRASFEKLGITVAAVSADTEVQTRLTIAASGPSFAMLYGMDIPAMQRLGLYISEPRSAQETDHRFPEPGLLVVNMEGILQVVDVANAPFVRPDLDTLLMGLSFVIAKNYPTRGTYR
jgi:peroxiredoxin